MTEQQKTERLNEIKGAIEKIENKKCNMYFMVADSKGMPNGAIEYVYSLAYGLKEAGYNVTMLHQEKEFIGVGEWLGPKYDELPHKNVELDNVMISTSDFVFIPDFFTSVLGQLKKIHCKKVPILCNKFYLTDVLPFTANWQNLDVRDVITNTDANKDFLERYFPGLKVHVVNPVISACFRTVEGKLQKPTVNVIAKTPSELNYITKTFYWKYPSYRWVSFKDLRGFPQEVMSDMLRDSAVTVWADRESNFGYPAVEAVKCGTLVVGLIPNEPKEWMIQGKDDRVLTDNILWAETLDDVCDLVAAIIDKWLRNGVPANAYENQQPLAERYTAEEFTANIKNVLIKDIIDVRCNSFKEVYGQLSAVAVDNKEINTEEEE